MKTNVVTQTKTTKKESSKPGVKGKVVVGAKKLHEEDETEEHEEKPEKEEKEVGKQFESKKVKVSRKKIEEVTSLVKRIQQLTGKRIMFGEAKTIKEDKIKKIKALVKLIEAKTGKKVVFEDKKK